MSGTKGVVKNNAKTSGKNSSPNTTSQNAESKDVTQNKTHDKEKLQVNVICKFRYLFFFFIIILSCTEICYISM